MFDLAAGTRAGPHPAGPGPARATPPRILVFDSGLGGLTVFPAVRRAVPAGHYLYAADDSVFPYGRLGEAELVGRVLDVMAALIARHAPDVVVIACHTASTLVLPPLRERWPAIRFVGTVPAIKPAVAASRSGLISVLATPGTVKREYTRALVDTFAADAKVTLVGATGLASLAEAVMRGETVADRLIAEAIAPAFVETDGRRTDVVVLACTHYPLLLTSFERLQPWSVTYIDPAGAIARRVGQVTAEIGEGVLQSGATREADPTPGLASALFTSNNAPAPALEAFLLRCGLEWQFSPAFAALAAEA